MNDQHRVEKAEERQLHARLAPGDLKGYVPSDHTVAAALASTYERRRKKPTVLANGELAKTTMGPFAYLSDTHVDPVLQSMSDESVTNIQVWLDNPIVAAAARRQRNPDLLSLFVSLHGVLHDLEDRFPGVPFRTLLSTSADRPANFIETLEAAGCDPDDIAIVAEHTGCDAPAINIDEPANNRERLRMELADDIAAGLDVDRSKWNREDWARAHAMPTPMSTVQRRVCATVLEGRFRTMKSIAAELKISPSTVRQTVIKLRYHRSRRLHEWSEE